MTAGWKTTLDRASVGVFLVAWLIAALRLGAPILHDGHGLALALGLLGGYVVADFVAGTAHWLADRVFEPETPLIGPMLIAPFREHHEDALAITRHDLFMVSGHNALVLVPVVGVVAALPLPSDLGSALLAAFALSLTLALFATNLLHRWAHAPSPPRWVRRLHAWRLVLTPEAHAIHHRGEHDRAYCVTSGWLNPLLDGLRFFERLERWIEPRPARRRRAS